MADVAVDRFVRQSEFVPRERLCCAKATVVGVGAIGRQVALQLAAIGAGSIRLIDHDVVDATNVTTQGYLAGDVGQPKVTAVAKAIAAIDGDVDVTCEQDRYRLVMATAEDAVFCCVDSIDTRRVIWNSAGRICAFWADGRMLGETLRIIAGRRRDLLDYYPTTLFPQSEAQSGRCTARSTIYAASIAASLMIHQFTRWLRGIPITLDVLFNLAAMELQVVKDAPRDLETVL